MDETFKASRIDARNLLSMRRLGLTSLFLTLLLV